MKMLARFKVSLQAIATLTLFYLVLPSSLSMSVLSSRRSLEEFKDASPQEDRLAARNFMKRRDDSDPWNLCYYGMPKVDCFNKYFDIYARLRKKTHAPPSRKIIGKRSSYPNTATPDDDLCDGISNPRVCVLLRRMYSDAER
ncbi:unnamed protein product [Lymnaea stagnalis]|uniref:Uncharacterized protein n=1 Tax=Lymnaea stagnalis TaxID=6523 RepID=A0AAV2GY53_LYMST